MRTLLIFCFLLTPFVAASAQQTAAAKQPPTALAAGDVYLPSSNVYVLVGKTGLGHEHGVQGSLASGRLRLGVPSDAGELVFDMKSFVADTPTARRRVGLDGESSASTRRQVNANMLGPDVLNVGAYARAVYRVDSSLLEPSTNTAKSRYRLKGELTLQRTTRPVSFVVDASPRNGWTFVTGTFKFRQSDFGMKPYVKAFGAVGVADELTVTGDLWVAPEAGVAQLPAGATR
jgi:polyisoprenoid-binding protein YceI